MTNDQINYHIAAIECDQADIFNAIHSMREQLAELEYSDPDSCSQYFEEDVWTIQNMCYSKVYRALLQIGHVLTALKAEMEEDE